MVFLKQLHLTLTRVISVEGDTCKGEGDDADEDQFPVKAGAGESGVSLS